MLTKNSKSPKCGGKTMSKQNINIMHSSHKLHLHYQNRVLRKRKNGAGKEKGKIEFF